MADDDDQPETDPATPDGDPDEQPDSSTEEPTEAPTGEPDADEALRTVLRNLTPAEVNRLVPGHLVIHYPARDVAIVIDGDSAIRLLRMFAARSDRHLKDRIGPDSTAANGWVVLDLDQPLAMTWCPGAPEQPRTVIDPSPVGADTEPSDLS